MSTGMLEHVNLTVMDPDKTAALFVRLFGWKVRWAGDSIHEGRTVHVGTDKDYLALYTSGTDVTNGSVSYFSIGGLNHIGIVVKDLDATEKRVIAEGMATFNHSDYDPGRRFYFLTDDDIEFEVVSYTD